MNWIADILGILTQSVTLPGWVVVAGAAVGAFFAFLLLARAEPIERPLTLLVLAGILLGGMAVGTAMFREVQASHVVSEARALEVRAAELDAAAAAANLGCLNADEVLTAFCETLLFENPENIAAARALLRARFALVEDGFEFVRRRKSPILLERIAVWRRPLERDPYGLTAAMLLDMRNCSTTSCPQVAFLGDVQQVNANMASGRYAAMVAKYAPMWERNARNRGTLAAPSRTGPFGLTVVDPRSHGNGPAMGEGASASEPAPSVNLPVEPREPVPAQPPPATAAPLPPPRPAISTAPAAARPRPSAQAPRAAPETAPEPAPPAAQ
ncbi:hypothetical protein [Xanthobacter pseudotagetidis]|uniref:hypothetical protein n=1 Tax=Xanthobacter pseudotagetidis TaxID=3119911 RepID=UPI00372CDC22